MGEVLLVPHVFDSGDGKGEALGELDATDDRERDEEIGEPHETCGAEEQNYGGCTDARSHDLRNGEIRGGDCYGGNGLHGLYGHWHAVDCTGDDVVGAGEDECGAEVEVLRKGEGQDDGDVGPSKGRGPR
ncbi:hypothetical protein HPP92_018828 [Vanilla planifolia]|uniref:Uncharacterized protein n=1 Tax=Vanilla planifolia TaxID=51239 RepID=A0A835UIS5_VANPL|nr:hypothetical protein HPP92_019402 [Vanilla planifolia]KAG0464664.1 hypothetical protein HPP92_018828 [Vanilla planifolia]